MISIVLGFLRIDLFDLDWVLIDEVVCLKLELYSELSLLVHILW